MICPAGQEKKGGLAAGEVESSPQAAQGQPAVGTGWQLGTRVSTRLLRNFSCDKNLSGLKATYLVSSDKVSER